MKKNAMSDAPDRPASRTELDSAFADHKPRFLSRLRAAGRTLEEAEDSVHDLYTETLERLPLLRGIRSFPAWLNSLLTRRMVDTWRHDRVRDAAGESDVADETLHDIIAATGLDPLDAYVRECLVEALNDALKSLPDAQRQVVEAQVFGGLTFQQIAEATGESIDTLTARKRYALKHLARALRHWIEE